MALRSSKLKFSLLIVILLFLKNFSGSFGFAKEKFVTVINPVRGRDFWTNEKQTPLTMPKELYQKLTEMEIPGTWLLRFDTLGDPEITKFFGKIDKSHELGFFFEVTPKFTEAARINYPQGGLFWHDSNKVFLSGYSPMEREKLIDEALYLFKYNYGYYPAVVGAWHIDAYSAQYLVRKYHVLAILLYSDQAGTDSYRIWGGFWGMPYYPSKFNILIPGQSLKNKIDVVVLQWAQRDPYLGYGATAYQSSYSFQVNDYLSRGQGLSYFNHLLNIYLENSQPFGQVTIGLENDYSWLSYKKGFEDELNEIIKREDVKFLTAGQFAAWYKNQYPSLSPAGKVEGTNFLNQSQKASWQFSPRFRVGLIEENGKKKIRDLRIYNENWSEPNLLTANPWPELSLEVPSKIDTVQYAEQLVEAPENLDYATLIKKFGSQKIPFKLNNYFLLLFYSFILLILVWFLRKNISLFFIIFFGSLSWSLPMIKSGLIYPFGMGFWGPNAHDGLWHVALINELAKFRIGNPVFFGKLLTNYHFGFDFLAALINRLSGIPAINLYFQFLPPLMAIFVGILVFRLVKKWIGSYKAAFWATFFTYFGGSLGWVVTLIRNRQIGGESMFWANQAVSSLINPPYALSIIFILCGLNLLSDLRENYNTRKFILAFLIFGLVIEVKVYAGLIVLGSLFLLVFYSRLFSKERFNYFVKFFLLSSFVAFLVFLPFNLKAGSLLVFAPFWFLRTMLYAQDRFFFPKLESARQVYFANHYWLKWFLAEILSLTIFLVGNLGTRTIGLLFPKNLIKKVKNIDEIDFLITSMTIISTMASLLFIQKGNPWNTIQFFYYTQFLLSLLSGVVVGRFLDSGKKLVTPVFLASIIAILTLPTTLATLKNDYLPTRPPARISFSELDALDFLNKQSEGVVLTYPYGSFQEKFFLAPKPVYAYETTAYVSALTNKPTYLEDEMNLEISGYDWQIRRKNEETFFTTHDKDWVKNFIKENKIKYIYLVKGQKMGLGEGDFGAKKVFENSEVRIFEVKW